MKRTLTIVFSVAAVLLLIVATGRLMGPKIGNTFSTISSNLPDGYGGGSEAAGPVNVLSKSERSLSGNAPAAAPAPAVDSSAAGQGQVQQRLVIENASLTLVVKDPKASIQEIGDLSKQFGGYVVSSSLSEADTPTGKIVPAADITIRVASEKLEDALTTIKEGAVDVRSEVRSGQDVTDQYVDLQAQLKAKEAAEAKLLEIMDQATRTQDVLDVYLQAQNVQVEIERLKGQIKYLEQASALSAVEVHLVAEAGTQPIAVGPWKPSGTAKQAIQDLIVFFQNFVDFLIMLLLNVLPKLILIAIPLFLVYLAGRAVYRRFFQPNTGGKEVVKG